MKASLKVIFTLSLLALSSQSYSTIEKGSVVQLDTYIVHGTALEEVKIPKVTLPKNNLKEEGKKILKESFQSFQEDNKAAINKAANVSILDGVQAPSKEAIQIEDLTTKIGLLDTQVKSTNIKNKDLAVIVKKQKESLDKIHIKKKELLVRIKSQRKNLASLQNKLKNSEGYSQILLKDVHKKAQVAANRLLENGKLITELSKAETKLQETIKSKKEEAAELRKVAQGFFKDGLNLQNDYDDLFEKGKQLSILAEKLNNESLIKSKMIIWLLEKNQEKENYNFQLKLAIEQYKRRLEALTNENKKLSDKNIALSKENTQLQESICSKDKAIHDLESEMSKKAAPILSEVKKIAKAESKDSNVIELITPEEKVVVAKLETKEEVKVTDEVQDLKDKVEELEEKLAENKSKREEAKEKSDEEEKDDLFADDKFAKKFTLMANMMKFMPSMFASAPQMQRQVVRQVTQTTSANNNFMNQYMQMMMMKNLMGQKTGFSMYDPYSASNAINTEDLFGGYSLMPGIIPMAERKGGAFNFNILNT